MSIKTRLAKLESAQVSNIVSEELDSLSASEKYMRMLNDKSYTSEKKLNHLNAWKPEEAYKIMMSMGEG